MKKKLSLIYLLVIIVAMAIIPVSGVYAKKIETMEANAGDGKITVSGTAEKGMLAVAISVYDEEEKKLIKTETTSVDNDSKYSYSIEVAKGTYVIKVADYDGGTYESKKVTVTKSDVKTEDAIQNEDANKEENKATTEDTSKAKDNATNPITGDNIMKLVAIFAISTIGVILVRKKNKKATISKH